MAKKTEDTGSGRKIAIQGAAREGTTPTTIRVHGNGVDEGELVSVAIYPSGSGTAEQTASTLGDANHDWDVSFHNTTLETGYTVIAEDGGGNTDVAFIAGQSGDAGDLPGDDSFVASAVPSNASAEADGGRSGEQGRGRRHACLPTRFTRERIKDTNKDKIAVEGVARKDTIVVITLFRVTGEYDKKHPNIFRKIVRHDSRATTATDLLPPKRVGDAFLLTGIEMARWAINFEDLGNGSNDLIFLARVETRNRRHWLVSFPK